jgi:hypothetical protein
MWFHALMEDTEDLKFLFPQFARDAKIDDMRCACSAPADKAEMKGLNPLAIFRTAAATRPEGI